MITVKEKRRPPSIRVLKFSTAFRRPDRMRFDCFEEAGRHGDGSVALQRTGDDIRLWRGHKGIVKKDNLSFVDAMAEAAGASRGAAYYPIALLLPDELFDYCLTEVRGAVLDDGGVIDGRACWRISGDYRRQLIQFWIEKDKYLVRQVSDGRSYGSVTVEQSVRYEPELGAHIPNYWFEAGSTSPRLGDVK